MESTVNEVGPCVMKRFILVLLVLFQQTLGDVLESETTDLFRIDGRVEVVSIQNKDWLVNTRILVDGGNYISHLRYENIF